MRSMCLILMALLLSIPAWGQFPSIFTDVTAESGVAFQHSFGDDDMSSILESTGSGCAFIDYDQDGDLDIYFVNGCYLEGISDPDSPDKGERLTNALYRNNGDGTFTDVTEQAGVSDEGYGMGCTVGDYDNDGDADLYVTNYGPNRFFENNGDGTFSDITERSGTGDPLWGVGATFLDYDNDGNLDIFVGNYLEFDPEYRLYYAADVFPGPLAYPGQRDTLYRNNGDGTFTDVTEQANITEPGRAMGVASADYNDDGWIDIFVANDAMANYLYKNNGDGTFTEVGLMSGVAFSEHGDASSSMGGDFGDFDLDGDLDLIVPDMTFNSFYRNLGNGMFEDVSAYIGVAEMSGQYWSWSGELFDADNDGDLDLLISNGNGHRLNTEEELFFINEPASNGERRFVDGAYGDYFYHKAVGRGLAVGDYDNDGDLDAIILNLDQRSVVLRNDGKFSNHWLLLRLIGTKSNRDGIGARVTLQTEELTQVAEKSAASGYLSQGDPRLHFGLGNSTQVDKVTIRWPSGIVQVLENIPVDQILEIAEQSP